MHASGGAQESETDTAALHTLQQGIGLVKRPQTVSRLASGAWMQALKKATADLEKAMGDAPATDAKAPPPPAASDTVKAPGPTLAL